MASKFKANLIVFLAIFIPIFTLVCFTYKGHSFFDYVVGSALISGLCFMFVSLIGINKLLEQFLDKRYYEKQDEINFQNNLRREIQRKRALSEIDNENLHYQNQLKIEYIAQVAQIHLQSNQHLANMYQQAIISNSTQNELTAQKQLLELEAELTKQGLI